MSKSEGSTTHVHHRPGGGRLYRVYALTASSTVCTNSLYEPSFVAFTEPLLLLNLYEYQRFLHHLDIPVLHQP